MDPAGHACHDARRMQDLKKFFRANPQAFLLLVVCVVLGLGTFLAVVFGLVTSGSTKSTGEPTDTIFALRVLLG
jgi:hypothetical protein